MVQQCSENVTVTDCPKRHEMAALEHSPCFEFFTYHSRGNAIRFPKGNQFLHTFPATLP
jgi:hypothetical protein